MPKVDDYEAWPRIQPRGNIDACRGDFYHWMRRLPAKMQGRELVNLAHLGYLMTIARQNFAAAAAESQTLLSPATPPHSIGGQVPGDATAASHEPRSSDKEEEALVSEAMGDVLAVIPFEAMEGPELR